MQLQSSIKAKKGMYSMQAFQKREKLAAKQLFYQAKNLPLKEKIRSLQHVLILNPFSAKYQLTYAKLLKDSGDTVMADQHAELAIGLQKARRDASKLKLSGNSLYYAALIQYYTGMFHNWNAGYTLAAELLRNLPVYRSRIANSPIAAKPQNAQLLNSHYAPKSNNARRQWPGANAAMIRRGAAAVITFFVMSFAGLNVSAAENNPNTEIVFNENAQCLLPDNQDIKNSNTLIHNNLRYYSSAGIANNNPDFGLDRIALILLILPLMALARAALPGKSKLALYIIISSILALGLNPAVQGQVASGWGVVKDTNGEGQNLARITYIRAETEDLAGEFSASGTGSYLFNNIDLITTIAEETPSLEELTTYTGTGQDHNFNIQTKKQPSPATIYNTLGQPITTINPQWDGEVAHYYWNGSAATGTRPEANMYIFVTTINNKPVAVKFMQTNSGQYAGNVYAIHNTTVIPNRHCEGASPKQSVINTTLLYNRLLRSARNDGVNTKSTKTLEKKFYVHLNPDSLGDQFLPQTDTIWLQEGPGNEIYHFVEPIPASIDQYFKLVDSNNREGLENFTIRAKDTDANGEILGETQTNTNGLALLENIPENALLYLEYGPENNHDADTSYYSSKGNTWQMLPNTWYANDTISSDTIKIALPNKNLIIPQTQNDTAPATIWTPASYITEMIRGPPAPHNGIGEPVNIEQAYRNEIRIWLNPNTSTWMPNYLTQIDSLFYADGTFPYIVVDDSIDTEGIEGIPYHHETNPYPGELGFNVRDNGSHTSLKKKNAYDEFSLNNNNTDYMNIILGGDIWITTDPAIVFKECVMRLNDFNDVTSRPSFGNVTATAPNEYDRAITRIIRVNQYNRVNPANERVQSYSLYYLQDSFNE